MNQDLRHVHHYEGISLYSRNTHASCNLKGLFGKNIGTSGGVTLAWKKNILMEEALN